MQVLKQKFRNLQEQESLEPILAWGLRMGLCLTLPVIFGFATGRLQEAVWVGLTAEALCWVDLKGSIAQRIQLVLGGILITLLSSLVGTLTGFSVLLSTLAMFLAGLISGLFKNLGDRGSGLAICVFVTFIISNAIPVAGINGLIERLVLTGIGGIWYLVLALAFSVTLRQNEPYRRSIALIWRSIGQLLETITKGWDGKSARSSLHQVYRKEIEVRKALDASIAFHTGLANQVSRKEKQEHNLAMIRKSTALVAALVVAMNEATENMQLRTLPPEIRNTVYGIYRTSTQAALRLSSFMVSLLPEENLLLQNRIGRIRELCTALETQLVQSDLPESRQKDFSKLLNLAFRSARLIERIVERLEEAMGEQRIYRSYSLLKTVYVLHPGNFFRAIHLLFNTKTEHFRYAVRIGVASAIAMAFSKILPGTHNYWIPFTVILIIQPYIGATLAKARDRLIGTVSGGLAGGLFLYLPENLFLKELLLFLSSLMMIVYLRKNYAVAAFFITVSLVLLIDIEAEASIHLIIVRALNTLVGAAIAVLSSFLLLPVWDKNKLPEHLAESLIRNYQYLQFTYGLPVQEETWTRFKRISETANSQAFESLQRYLEEPTGQQKMFVQPYQLLTHNVRITHDLNQIHLERENPHSNAGENILPENEKILAEICNRMEALLQMQLSQPEFRKIYQPFHPVLYHGTPHETELLQKINSELQGMQNTLLK